MDPEPKAYIEKIGFGPGKTYQRNRTARKECDTRHRISLCGRIIDQQQGLLDLL